ncbi:MAG: Re/Si-specific NAD(P)(+) transhydrogenase subunit alpha [Acidobacteriota bacterium]|nr:Re/Si-specific NAD(P)(+) transhydrogenase subunit alpha [Acidobacteriota bacterium]MDH3785632.1 Re/Si-specific NAD(P)(+) transhydrogenase subunit alpha [Acidobacteriota bacterium]
MKSVGVVKETFPGERRVAIVPAIIPILSKAGFEIHCQRGAGEASGYEDANYAERGATLVDDRESVFSRCEILCQVRSLGANTDNGRSDLPLLRSGQAVFGMFEPLTERDSMNAIAERGVTQFAMEMIPRITRAQSMDVLSSMATIAGYKAVLIAAQHLPKMFPMLMTAAGTVSPAKVLVIGAGVAGLQAIASSKRMGAVVSAYDVRSAVKEEVESLGAKFVEMDLDSEGAQDAGGYAKALGEEFYRKQRELMTRVIAEQDVVITTAAVPGKKAPLLVTTPMVEAMHRGGVIVDLAAERGGNCELTEPGQTVERHNITIAGPLNIPSEIPFHASQMYAKNMATLLTHVFKDDGPDFEDEITRDTVVTHGGRITNERVLEVYGGQG